jgi:hypothetical protein
MQLNSSQTTLLLLVLREIRLDTGTHPGHLALFTGKTPKEWASVESGKTSLTLHGFTSASYALGQQPSHVLWLAEQLATKFTPYGWYFQPAPLGKEDDLLPLIDQYFTSEGYEALKLSSNRTSVTALAQGNHLAQPTIVQYCCVQGFREWVDAGAIPQETSPSSDSYEGL